jgi:ABC-type amino acid transport substrate-binding protein/tRNA A-37 threonylcarbamoyl transferase component Bud32
MNETLPEGEDESLRLARQVDAACSWFEAAWQAAAAGQAPRLEDFLGDAPGPAREALLRELIPLDIHYRCRQGDVPSPADYGERFPSLDAGWLAGVTRMSAPAQPRGRLVGDYELLEKVGRGGMGVVYKARQVSLNRVVALKMIRAGQLASPEEVRRFRREAESIARLDHPNIVPIYEIGEEDEQHYFSMKLVPGGSLAQHLVRFADPEAAARLIATVARAVQHAHEKGIVHRDLKPANVLLDVRGEPHVGDFGLAKQLDASATIDSIILGTPSYMAPEQAAGKSREVGPAADVYALGAILYELLTGQPPFAAETPLDTILRVLHKEPVSVAELRPEVPRNLVGIVMRCLEKEPARRYASAAALADDLTRFANGQPLPELPAAPTRPADDSLQRVRRVGKLVVALDPTYRPMEFWEGGRLAGFDIDLGEELARRLGVRVLFVPVYWEWDQVADRLDEHQFDVVLSAVKITADRRRRVDFEEYLRLAEVFVCRRTGPFVRDEEDLAGKVVAVQLDTHAHQAVEELARAATGTRIEPSRTTTELFDALRLGRADVTVVDEPVGRSCERQDPNLVVTGCLDRRQVPTGIALRKGDRELKAAVAAALADMREDGSFARLRTKWLEAEPIGSAATSHP